MKRKLLFLLVFAGLLVMDYSCNILDPSANDGTVEVSTSGYSGGCSIGAQLDGGTNYPIGAGSLYSFPPVSPGKHTLTLTTTGSVSCGTCGYNGNTIAYNCTVNVSSGKLSIAVLQNTNGACSNNNISLTCP